MPTIKRRRDRVNEEPGNDDQEDEVAALKAKLAALEATQEEPDDDDEVEVRRPARKDPAATSVRHSSSQDKEEEDDDPRPRKAKAKAAVPEGVRGGWSGADTTSSAGGDAGGVTWLKIADKRVELFAFLEDAPLTSFRQHWLEPAGEGKSRPYLCPGSKCPICAQGDNPSGYFIFNVLHLSGGSDPEVKALQINQSAYKNLKEVFADRKTGDPVINAEGVYASGKRAGQGFQTRTTFTKVKERDLQDDWPEVFEFFDIDDLAGMLNEAMEDLYAIEEVSPKATPRRELEKLAKYLDEPEEAD
jgi:hypothetical protein